MHVNYYIWHIVCNCCAESCNDVRLKLRQAEETSALDTETGGLQQ